MDAQRSMMILNTFVVGMLVFGLAQLEYVALQRWERWRKSRSASG